MKKQIVVCTLPLCVLLALNAHARITTLSGGVSTGYDYSDRTYDSGGEAENDQSTRDDDISRFVLSPFITIRTESPRDSAELSYAPSFLFDTDDSDENDTDHRLNFDYERFFTKRWQLNFADRFVDTDEYNSYAPGVDESGVSSVDREDSTASLRDEEGRRRYYTNILDVSSTYTYYEDSFVTFGYAWDLLRNEDLEEGTSYEDYDRHDFYLNLDHRLNSQWKVNGVAGFIRGLYDSPEGSGEEAADDTDDLDEYRAGVTIEHELTPRKFLNSSYNYTNTDYDSELRFDTQIQDFAVGGRWLLSKRTEFSASGGPTYVDTDGLDGEWSFNGNLSLNYTVERGYFAVSASAGNEFDNFSGTNERGVTEYWQASANVNYLLFERTTVAAYLSYRDEDRDQSVLSDGEIVLEPESLERYAAGCSVSYAIHENWTVDLSYGYVDSESDNQSDSYDDHSVKLLLTYSDDFFRW